MMRRMRTRLPTYLSTGLGALVDIANTPWDQAGGMKQDENEVCLGRQDHQILLGEPVNHVSRFEQGTDGSAKWSSRRRMRIAPSVCQLVDFRM
jgi:hypothetical protein